MGKLELAKQEDESTGRVLFPTKDAECNKVPLNVSDSQNPMGGVTSGR